MLFPDGLAGIDLRGAILRLVLRVRGGSRPTAPGVAPPAKGDLSADPAGSSGAGAVGT